MSNASSRSSDPISASPTPQKSSRSPRSSPPFATTPTSASSSTAAFVLSTRPRLPSPFHQVKPTFPRGPRCVVDCQVWSSLVTPSPSASHHPIKGRGGRAHHPSSLVFCGLPRIPPLSKSHRFFTIPPISGSHRFQGFPPIFRGPAHFRSFRASPRVFEVPPTFGVPPISRGLSVSQGLADTQGLSIIQSLSITQGLSVTHGLSIT